MVSMKKQKNFRKRKSSEGEEEEYNNNNNNNNDLNSISDQNIKEDDEQKRRLALEEVKFLQKQRERKFGLLALPTPVTQQASSVAANGSLYDPSVGGLVRTANDGGGDGADKDELVLQDTFAQETAVMEEDPNMLKYIEQELAKKRGKNLDEGNQGENDIRTAEDELYLIPEHLKVKKRNSNESSTQWTTGIAEIQLPIEYKLKNIEETEAAKKLLQEKRLVGRAKTNPSIPASYSADYFQRGKDYAEKLRREHPELYKERTKEDNAAEPGASDSGVDGAVRRPTATDEFTLDRFRKRERNRGMRR